MNNLEKITILILQLQILFIGHETLFPPSYSSRQVTENASGNICLTPGCAEAATKILNNIDEDIDPCDDFYQFACGGWENRHTIPEGKSEISVVSGAEDALNSKLRILLDKPLTGIEPDFVKMLKTLYDSCMDTNAIDTLQSEPLKKTLGAVGGWPVVVGNEWNESKFNWIDMLIKFRDIGYSHNNLMHLSVMTDYKNNSNHILNLRQPVLGLPDKSYYSRGFNDSTTSAYFDYMVAAAVKLGADKENVRSDLMKSYQFEAQLANFTLSGNEVRNMGGSYNKFTIKQLQEIAPEIDWLRYINGILNSDIEVTEDEPIIVSVPSFVKKFSKLITTTDKRTVANYLVWRLVKESVRLLPKDWRDIEQNYSAVLNGKTQESPRWEQCLSPLQDTLSIALGAFYVRHYFKEDSKDMAMEMVKYIRRIFLRTLEKADWMETATKEKAIEKANSITPHIGYPEELLNDTAVIELYPDLSFGEKSYLDNVLKLKKFAIDQSFKKLRKLKVKGGWKDHAVAAMMDAYYNPFENSIVFPAGVLQDVFFSRDRPNYLNFGAIGIIIGHEITHGFDNIGKQFDKDGNNRKWWDPETNKRFNEKKQCIIDQYSNYTVPGLNMSINGDSTQAENIADNGAIKEAYKAYHLWVAENGVEARLPEVKYTPDQLFWISAANVWCGKYKPEMLKLNVFAEVHTLPKFRVIGPFSNAVDFSKDFKCPLGSRMNPEKKCELW